MKFDQAFQLRLEMKLLLILTQKGDGSPVEQRFCPSTPHFQKYYANIFQPTPTFLCSEHI